MTDPSATMNDLHAAFDAAFHDRAPLLRLRAQSPTDHEFLVAQFIACSPLVGLLPEPMLRQQAEWHLGANDDAFPDAMQRIVTLDDKPIGRIVYDWTSDSSHGVDIAVMPEFRATGAGPHILYAWVTVLDAHGLFATLDVRRDNPAIRRYLSLGFVPTDPSVIDTPSVAMMRHPRVASDRVTD